MYNPELSPSKILGGSRRYSQAISSPTSFLADALFVKNEIMNQFVGLY